MSVHAEQLAYVLERSAFYREKFARHDASAELEALPLTTKQELRDTVTEDNPFGAHLCVEPREIARIYSTSGTTGAPSYIPLTASDLENWIETSARSYAASGSSSWNARTRRSVLPVPTGTWHSPMRSNDASAAPAANGPALYVETIR